jgi:hypothetical protein
MRRIRGNGKEKWETPSAEQQLGMDKRSTASATTNKSMRGCHDHLLHPMPLLANTREHPPAVGASTTVPIFSHVPALRLQPYALTLPSASCTSLVSPSLDPGCISSSASATFTPAGSPPPAPPPPAVAALSAAACAAAALRSSSSRVRAAVVSSSAWQQQP